MSDRKKKPAKKPVNKTVLPPQSSATDTSNWDDRAFTAPDGKDHIENAAPRDRRNENRYPPRRTVIKP